MVVQAGFIATQTSQKRHAKQPLREQECTSETGNVRYVFTERSSSRDLICPVSFYSKMAFSGGSVKITFRSWVSTE